MNSPFFAKPNQTYEEHLYAAYHAWQEITNQKRHVIERISDEYGYRSDLFLERSLLTLVMHDIGKAAVSFQEMMAIIQAGQRPDYSKNYRHELISGASSLFALQTLNKGNGGLIGPFPFESLCILGHHKPITPSLHSFYRETHQKPAIYKPFVDEALVVASDIFEQEGYTFPQFSLPMDYLENPWQNMNSLLRGVSTLLWTKPDDFDPSAVRNTYLLLKALLHTADWYGSAGISVPDEVTVNPEDFTEKIALHCSMKGVSFSGLRQFQKECGEYVGNMIMIAPTGSGKTEASLLWALKNRLNLGGGRLIYLLPTMVTANSTYARLQDYFGAGNVGLTHSTASLIRSAEEEDRDIVRNALFEKSFLLPATVGTVDQLLVSGFHRGRWALVGANTAGGVVVIDEIHAYDAWTLGLIVSMIHQYSALGTRFLLMSATMPKILVELLSEALGTPLVIRDQELLSSSRNTFEVSEDQISALEDEIRSEMDAGRRVLVVVNTVQTCREIAQQLGDLSPVCFHSKFILRHRKKKEEEIDVAQLVVATQVVEVSLDIDFDVMFTECAPPDALVQRAGRVNRRRTKEGTRIIICAPSKGSKKIYDRDETGILERTFECFLKREGRLTEDELTQIVDRMYVDTAIADLPLFQEARAQYARTQKKLSQVFDNPDIDNPDEVTRNITYIEESVIPDCYREKVMSLSPRERRWYEVKVPYWYSRKHRHVIDSLVFCDLDYTSEYGAEFIESNAGGLEII